jgi:hypothetical protein
MLSAEESEKVAAVVRELRASSRTIDQYNHTQPEHFHDMVLTIEASLVPELLRSEVDEHGNLCLCADGPTFRTLANVIERMGGLAP